VIEVFLENGGTTMRLGENTAAAAASAARAAASAANAEAFTGPTYTSTALGLAGTVSGDYFAVNASGVVTIYLNDSGSAVAQRAVATTAALAATTGAALIGKTGSGTVQDFIDDELDSRVPGVAGQPQTHWSEYFGNPGTANVSRKQRLLVGVSAMASSERPNTTPSWVETYYPGIEADSTLISTSAIGSLAISGASRTSDFRTWTGGSAGGAQGVSGFSLNDDTVGSGIAAAVFGDAIHLAGVDDGITEAAEFSVCSSNPVVDIFPRSIVAGSAFCLNLSVGFRTGYTENVSAALVLGSGFNSVKIRKGFVAIHSHFDITNGAGGAGVLGDMPSNMSMRWLNTTTDAVEGEMWMNPTAGLMLTEPAWRTYTPTVTSSSGTITTVGAVSGRYKKLGRTLHINAAATITTNGTGAGLLQITIPSGMFAAANTILTATTSNGDVCVGLISASDNKVACYASGFTYPMSDGETITVSGTIELSA